VGEKVKEGGGKAKRPTEAGIEKKRRRVLRKDLCVHGGMVRKNRMVERNPTGKHTGGPQ